MNLIEKVAKILRDKVVLDVGGQFPVKGHINMDAYALIEKTVAKTDLVESVSGSTSDLNTMLASKDYGVYTDAIINGPEGNNFVAVRSIGSSATHLVGQIGISYAGRLYWRAIKEGTIFGNWQQVASQADITALNNKITALKAQISGGGVNLLDVTNGELGNLSGNDGSLLDGFKNLYRTPNMIPVSDDATYLLNIATPGDEKPVIEKVCFYDANGIFTRKSFAQAIRFGFTPQNGECFIRFTIVSTQATPGFPDDASWPKYGVTLTVTNSLQTRLTELEAQIKGGTTA